MYKQDKNEKDEECSRRGDVESTDNTFHEYNKCGLCKTKEGVILTTKPLYKETYMIRHSCQWICKDCNELNIDGFMA